MRQRPGEIARHQHVKALRRKVRLLGVHDGKIRLQAEDLRRLACPVDHVRRQVDARGLVSLGRENESEKARTRSQIQHAQRTVLRDIAMKFFEPALVLFIFKFPDALGLKGLRPVRPVMGDAVLDRFHRSFSLRFFCLFPAFFLYYRVSRSAAEAPRGDNPLF